LTFNPPSTGKAKEDIVVRLRKIEGQIRGLQKMVDEGRECLDVLMQISAVSKGMEKVTQMILMRYIEACRTNAAEAKKSDSMETLCHLLSLAINKGVLGENDS